MLLTLREERERLSALRATLRRERLSALSGKTDAVLLYRDIDTAALRLYAEEGAALATGTLLVLLPVEDGCRYAMASVGQDVRERSATLHAAFGGRGGGKPTLVQGSFAAPAEAVAAAFSE
jgi:alanyl-tRNA synthetase